MIISISNNNQNRWIHRFIFSVLITTLTCQGVVDIEFYDGEMRWASNGGGWRAQFACVGLANLLGRAGLLPTTTSSASSPLSAISTNSGSTWFSTQLFYSEEFYEQTVQAPNGDAVYDFVIRWMDAYQNMSQRVIDEYEQTSDNDPSLIEQSCDTIALGNVAELELWSDFCQTIVYFGGDWALLVESMLDAASTEYGDEGFVAKQAGSTNRIVQLQNTDLFIQAGLAPNHRVRSSNHNDNNNIRPPILVGGTDDTAVYLKEKGQNSLYAVISSAGYVVNGTGTEFVYSPGLASSSTLFEFQTGTTSSQHNFQDWQDFHLYPGDSGTVTIHSDAVLSASSSSSTEQLFRPAFGNGPATVTQLAAISSAAAGAFSPAIPSIFTQVFSKQHTDGGPVFEGLVAKLYDNPLFDNFAVCSQWPNAECGPNDAYFIDGGFVDNPSLALNIGQYHASKDYDLEKPLRILLTNPNQEWENDNHYYEVLQYFDSPNINQGVEPGEFSWSSSRYVPHPSTQIFGDYLDATLLNEAIIPIKGSNMTTALLQGTTIANPAYGIRVGQVCEILLININEPITTFIVTPTIIDEYKVPLANMTKNIAENEELLKRVQEFFRADDAPVVPTEASPITIPPVAVPPVTVDPVEPPTEAIPTASPVGSHSHTLGHNHWMTAILCIMLTTIWCIQS